MEKLDEVYDSFGKIPAEPSSYFESMEDYFMLMKILYENLDIESQTLKPESPNLASLRSMMTYIEEHYMEHITLADIALSGTCCKSKCSLLFKKYLLDTPYHLYRNRQIMMWSDIKLPQPFASWSNSL